MNWEAGAIREPASPKTCRGAMPIPGMDAHASEGKAGRWQRFYLCRCVSQPITAGPEGSRLMIHSSSQSVTMIEMVFPGQTNHYGTLFGGHALRLMDKAA